MYENEPKACKPSPKQLTEAERILDAFDFKLGALDNIYGIVRTKVDSLGGFEKFEKPSDSSRMPEAEAEVHSFMNELDSRLVRLQKYVDAFDAVRYNLERLV